MLCAGPSYSQSCLYILEDFHFCKAASASFASPVDVSTFRLGPKSSSFYLWHSRLGHVSRSRLNYLVSTGVLGDVSSHDISECAGCKLGKFIALPFSSSTSTSFAPFDLIHYDVWGPAPLATKGGPDIM